MTSPHEDPTTAFTIGEEVLHDGVRYIIAGVHEGPPMRYRLLATDASGARIVWSPRRGLHKIETYTRPNDDTARL